MSDAPGKPAISVIICSRDRWAGLKDTLASFDEVACERFGTDGRNIAEDCIFQSQQLRTANEICTRLICTKQ